MYEEETGEVGGSSAFKRVSANEEKKVYENNRIASTIPLFFMHPQIPHAKYEKSENAKSAEGLFAINLSALLHFQTSHTRGAPSAARR